MAASDLTDGRDRLKDDRAARWLNKRLGDPKQRTPEPATVAPSYSCAVGVKVTGRAMPTRRFPPPWLTRNDRNETHSPGVIILTATLPLSPPAPCRR